MPLTEDNLRDREQQIANAQPYVEGPFTPRSFSVNQRDTFHFDVYATRRPGYVHHYYKTNPDTVAYPMRDGTVERAFAIRGEDSDIYIRDERWNISARPPAQHFPSVAAAMAWVCGTLMGV
jgi:hypothetical protein